MASTENVSEHTHPRWAEMWKAGIAEGEKFDARMPAPALVDLINKGVVPNGRALVPGCGRGYEVFALASPNRHVVGLDLAEESIRQARLKAESMEPKPYPNFELIAGDFFAYEPEEKFDFIFDYTFLCALAPSVRDDWVEKMKSLLAPGGELMTLIFPICDKTDGPPYAMSIPLVSDLLTSHGFEPIQVEMLPSELCHPGRDGTGPWGATSAIGRWRVKEATT